MALAENPNDRERLDGAFRAFHTLKGAAGIVEFGAMTRTLHAAEDILGSLRSSEEPINPRHSRRISGLSGPDIAVAGRYAVDGEAPRLQMPKLMI